AMLRSPAVPQSGRQFAADWYACWFPAMLILIAPKVPKADGRGRYKSSGGNNPRAGDAFMNRFRFTVGLSIAVLLPASAMAAAQHVFVQPDSLKGGAAPPVLPQGAQIAVLYGDPGKAGPFVFRLRFPAGYKVAAHKHPNDYN